MKAATIPHGLVGVFMRGVNAITKSARASGAPRPARKRARLRRGEEGAAIVEVALMMPILMTIILGLFVLGILFKNYMILTNAVGSGAQYLQALSTSNSTETPDPCAATTTVIQNSAPTLIAANITLTYTLNGSSYGTTCAGAMSKLVVGAQVTVQAYYPCNFLLMSESGPSPVAVSQTNYSTGCQLPASSTQLIY